MSTDRTGRLRYRYLRRLSPREAAALQAVAAGATGDEVSAQLDTTPAAARHVLKAARRKLDARTSAHAVAVAITVGAIDTPTPEP